VTAARRKGVEAARGKYIVFADADDELLQGALQSLYQTIEETQADEVIARYRSQDKVVSPIVFSGFTDCIKPIWYIITGKNRFPILWACIFRRELLTDVLDTPREIIEGEDKMMQVKILAKSPKVYFSKECVYEYQVGLPNTRRRTLERERLYDNILRQVLTPHWDKLRSGFMLHQLKEYENFVREGQYHVRKDYYAQELKVLPADIPLYDKVIWHLPPVLSRPFILLYRKIIKMKQRGL
jgi:glycosyltransferase involved in cell wall biosynthesis